MKGNRKSHPLDWRDAKTILTFLEGVEQYHHLIITAVGFFTGFRIKNSRVLKYVDFQQQVLDLRIYNIGKPPLPITKELRRIVNVCQQKLKCSDNDHLFIPDYKHKKGSISTTLANRRMREAFDFVGFTNIPAAESTIRKTFALRYLNLLQQAPGDPQTINELTALLKQSDTQMTRQYIGLIEPEIIQYVFDNFY